MKYRDYLIAGIRLRLTAPHLLFAGLGPFAASVPGDPDIEIRVVENLPPPERMHRLDAFDFPDADADCRLYRTAEGFRFTLTPRHEGQAACFRIVSGSPVVETDLSAEHHPAFARFGIWMVFNIFALRKGVVAIHSSVLLHAERGVLCLGESGTGKSTHTRLWREHVPGTTLLNDDSPLLCVRDGEATVCGSPWSGKTPCYRNEAYPVRAFIRLSQASENRIERLPVIRAYGALLPSFPPSFAYDEELSDAVNALLSDILKRVEVYHLGCLPDAAAAQLACRTLFEA